MTARERGVWNGRPAVVLRTDRGMDGKVYTVIQVEETAQMGRGKSYERIITVTSAQWRAANPSKESK